MSCEKCPQKPYEVAAWNLHNEIDNHHSIWHFSALAASFKFKEREWISINYASNSWMKVNCFQLFIQTASPALGSTMKNKRKNLNINLCRHGLCAKIFQNNKRVRENLKLLIRMRAQHQQVELSFVPYYSSGNIHVCIGAKQTVEKERKVHSSSVDTQHKRRHKQIFSWTNTCDTARPTQSTVLHLIWLTRTKTRLWLENFNCLCENFSTKAKDNQRLQS